MSFEVSKAQAKLHVNSNNNAINRTADADAIDLLALLPELLLADRALTRNGTRKFLERCHQVVALQGLQDLLQRPDGRFRRRLASANDDERVQTDVLKLIRKAEYGRESIS